MYENDKLEDEAAAPVRFSVTVPRHLHDELERTAQENDTSIAWVVRKAVASYFQGSSKHQHQDMRHQR